MSAIETFYGCGRRVTIHTLAETPAVTVHVNCGDFYEGELIQCEDCQESKPAPGVVDPADEDANAELEAERRFIQGEREEGNVP